MQSTTKMARFARLPIGQKKWCTWDLRHQGHFWATQHRQTFFGSMFKKAPTFQSELPHNAHGCRTGHSREEAMMVCNIISWKLKRLGLCHVNAFHDMTNAFLCTPHKTLDTLCRKHMCIEDATLMNQRHMSATIIFVCPDGKIA